MLLIDILERLRGKSSTLVFADDKGVESVRSFHDLYCDTLDLMEHLGQMGICAGMRIGILAPNSYHWMVWDLACLNMRCVSVALPQDPPKQPLGASVDQYSLALLACHSGWMGMADHAEPSPHVLDLAAANQRATVNKLLQPPVHAPDTHSLVFSSGTTGKTKGLITSARGTENLLNLYADAFGVERGERFLTFLPFANYQQRMVYYFCLYHGVDFVSVPFPVLFSGLKKHQPSFMIAPPIFYETLHNLALAGSAKIAADPQQIAARLRDLTGGRIRYMITGMAPIKRNTLDFFWSKGITLYEAFGITEAGMVAWNKPGSAKPGTVGKPAEAGSVTLADDGEVIVTRSALLSQGYFESSDEDARTTFIGPQSVATGDIAEYDSEGFLRIVGRKKDAIVTKTGEKFHPEPIESQIQLDPRVKLAVLLGGDGLGGITAIVSTDQASDVQAENEIRAHVNSINGALPPYQQVKRVIFTTQDFSVESGLRTKNLKLNRKAIAQAFAQLLEMRHA